MYLQSSVSNLQRLFSGTPASRSPHLDSVIEESHTTGLLFPEGPSLVGTASNSEDTIQSPCDVRIVIAQDGAGISQQRTILYDSHPAPRLHNSPPDATPNRQRAGSFTGSGGLTAGLGNKSRAHQPRTAPHSRQTSQSILTSPLSPVSEFGGLFGNSIESLQCKLAREGREETDSLLKCMFGTSSGLPCTSSTTKLHVRPPKQASSYEERPSSSARESPVAAGFPKRRTPLTRSTTAGDLQADGSQHTPRQNSSAIWITRLFSIDAESHRDLNDLEVERLSPKSRRKDNMERRKAPPIAIAVVLQTSSNRPRPSTPSYRSSGSSSSSPKTWSFDGSLNPNIAGSESNSDLENVTFHWSVIDRALREAQTIARCKIIAIQRSMQLTSRALQLPAGALQELPLFPAEMDRIGKRIATAFKIRKVATGQNRWGVWRAEARFIQKWGNTRDQNFFFFNLLTNFLAVHTEWLEMLAPSQYKRRYAEQARMVQRSANSIQRRTVIISKDKMAARRLIFLLSAFLPGNHPSHAFDWRTQSDRSKTMYSDSPPNSRTGLQQPFKRFTDRRIKETPATGKISFQTQSKTSSNATEGHIERHFTDDQNPSQTSRRASDAKPVALLITSDGSVTRKSSTTTTTTVRPDSTSPMTYFATHTNDCALNGPGGRRPSTSESFAAPLALQRTLSRSDSNEHSAISTDSHPGSVWGSLTKMWSSRRGSSTEASDRIASSEEGLGISGISQVVKRPSTLNQMVAEVEQAKADQSAHLGHANGMQGQRRLPLRSSNAPNSTSTGTSPLKHETQIDQFPLKLSVDGDDGIIDVGLPQMDSLPSSFGSTASSPLAVHTAASSFNDRSSHHSVVPKSAPRYADSETNVAGWLRDWHEDFTLQAVRPRKNLMEDIRSAMRRTPPSSNDEDAADEWREVSSTLIADTENFTLTRLSLRRESRSTPDDQTNAPPFDPAQSNQDEEIIEENLVEMDPILTDAVEKVISHSGESSRIASRNPSRAPSPTRRRQLHEGHHNHSHSTGLEIPYSECRRMVLGALEQVAQSVSADMVAKDGSGKAIGKQGLGRNEFAESALREGIRKWFQEVDRRTV